MTVQVGQNHLFKCVWAVYSGWSFSVGLSCDLLLVVIQKPADGSAQLNAWHFEPPKKVRIPVNSEQLAKYCLALDKSELNISCLSFQDQT